MLLDLLPATGRTVGFLTPAGSGSPASLMEKVRCTPIGRVREDMQNWAEGQQKVPLWAQRLVDQAALQRLVDVLDHAYGELVAPLWPQIDRLARADHAMRVRSMAEDGIEGLLKGLNPRYIKWNSPVLEISMASGRSGDVHLCGRGILLIPSFFDGSLPAIDETAEPPWLLYPVHLNACTAIQPVVVSAATRTDVPQSLGALLGRTRATVLYVIADHPGCTTTELGHRAGIAPASASEHATILRTAGLITTTRHRNNALHTLTETGIALLNTSTASP
ncbi:ArsR/SmtB family transcription factor [Streptomyces sp. NPDC015220]|uniref:ArsR/SmtB family transcription factor n=1 Tax=Streptomyces sp. NPDC015220 TaxID=3364947 RepID=UPI0036FB4359